MTRIWVAAALGLALTSLLAFRMVKLQVVDRQYYLTRAEENRMRLSAVPPVRGLITDRNGVLLAENTPAFVIEIVPEQVKDMDQLLERLRVEPDHATRRNLAHVPHNLLKKIRNP